MLAHEAKNSACIVAAFCAAINASCIDRCPDEEPGSPGSGVEVYELRKGGEKECGTRRIGACGDVFTLQSAASDWNAATGGAVCMDVSSTCLESDILFTTAWHPYFDEYMARGVVDGNVVHFNTERLCGSRVWHAVVRHEIGHLVGLPHMNDMNSLMNYRYERNYTPINVGTDVVQLYMDTHKCNIETLLVE